MGEYMLKTDQNGLYYYDYILDEDELEDIFKVEEKEEEATQEVEIKIKKPAGRPRSK